MFAMFRRAAGVALLLAPALTVDAVAQPSPSTPLVYEATKRTDPRMRRETAAEIGTLRMMTAASRNAVLSRVSGDKIYDLSVQYFIGLPSWYGAEDLPPIIARAVLIDVAGLKNVKAFPDAYRISKSELEEALRAQRLTLRDGDIVLIRGGKITMEAAEFLAETSGAMLIGGDYLSLEAYKYGRPDLTVPVHNYLLNKRGIAIIQVDNLEDLARDKVYEFAFVAAPLRSRGQELQFRPLAFPLK